jgi:hypothetical protein
MSTRRKLHYNSKPPREASVRVGSPISVHVERDALVHAEPGSLSPGRSTILVTASRPRSRAERHLEFEAR